MKKSSKWIIAFLGIIAAGVLCCIVLVSVIDPFFQYHAPLESFPYQVDNQGLQNPGMARNFDYNSIIIGSSVTANFYGGWFDEDFGCDSIKLVQNAAFPRDYRNLFMQVDKGCDDLKYVFWTIDPFNFKEPDTIAYPIEEYLYDSNPLNDVKYWVNADVLTEYILKPMFDAKDATDFKDVYETHSVLWYGREFAMKFIDEEEQSDTFLEPDALLETAAITFDDNIAPIIESHKDTEFYISFAPLSIMRWYSEVSTGRINAQLEVYRYTMERLLEYDNVKLFCFADDLELISDLNRYADAIHFDREVSHMMEQSMASGAYMVTKENMNERIDTFKEYVLNYNYSAAWE